MHPSPLRENLEIVASVDRSPQSRIARFAALSPAERRLFFHSVFLIPAIAAAVRIWGLHKTLCWMESHAKQLFSQEKQAKEQPMCDPQRILRMVEAGARHGLVHGNCLSQSLVLWFLLRRNFWNARFCVGGRHTHASFEAHAWVELHGEVLNDQDHLRETFRIFEPHISRELSTEK